MIVKIDKLPHKEPIRFIKEVVKNGRDDAISMIEFNEKPTLSAVVESAAQNVIFITSLYRLYNGGVLTGIKNVVFHKPLERGSYRVESKISTQLENFCLFSFEIFKDELLMASGEFNVVMNRREKILSKGS